MKVIMKRNGPKSFEVDPVGKYGTYKVGRGRTLTEALGNFLISYQDELGVEIELDKSARKAELARRRRLLKGR